MRNRGGVCARLAVTLTLSVSLCSPGFSVVYNERCSVLSHTYPGPIPIMPKDFRQRQRISDKIIISQQNRFLRSNSGIDNKLIAQLSKEDISRLRREIEGCVNLGWPADLPQLEELSTLIEDNKDAMNQIIAEEAARKQQEEEQKATQLKQVETERELLLSEMPDECRQVDSKLSALKGGQDVLIQSMALANAGDLQVACRNLNAIRAKADDVRNVMISCYHATIPSTSPRLKNYADAILNAAGQLYALEKSVDLETEQLNCP